MKPLCNKGVQVHKFEEHEYGKFGWITDPEGFPHLFEAASE
jgi:hypothetical protein